MATGATPVAVPIRSETWGIDPSRLPEAITPKTRAIIPVHLYGEDAGDFRPFGLPVIEDACESLGLVPLRGDITCYSFYANKIITTGEGGMICGSPEVIEKAKLWRNGGFDEAYSNIVPGLNYRMTNMQAALGLAQIGRLDYLLGRRLANVRSYKRLISGRGKWLFVAKVKNPRVLAEQLAEHGVQTRPVFTPLNKSPAFSRFADTRKFDFSASDEVWKTGLCLPTGPHVSPEGIIRIARILHGNINVR